MNAGALLKDGFHQLLETLGGTVIVHRNFNCPGTETFEAKGLKNSPEKNSQLVMFQFPEKIDVNTGDVLQQKGGSAYWRISSIEEHIASDVLISFNLYVNKIDAQGNLI